MDPPRPHHPPWFVESKKQEAELMVEYTNTKKFDGHEPETARLLAEHGNIVSKYNAPKHVQDRNADAYVNGRLTEFKKLETANPTAGTVVNRVKKSFKKKSQAPSIVINARGTGMPIAEAVKAFSWLRSEPLLTNGRLEHMIIFGDGYTVTSSDFRRGGSK